ncbi:MAG: NAD-dependent epimerase/dehydratase family protein, partial [Rhodospirillales bacterium]
RVQHLVFFSCSIMYPSSDQPLREEDFDANQPLKPYYFGAGWTKVYLEKMAEFFATTSKTRFTVLRHTNIYGPHDKFDLERSHMIGATITKALSATDGKLVLWGNGEEVRDVLHVDDLTDAVLKALSRQATPFELFNIGLGRAVPVRELAAQIVKASGRDLAIVCDTSKPSLPFKVALDCAKAERFLSWKPKIQPEEGLAQTVAWRKSLLSGST